MLANRGTSEYSLIMQHQARSIHGKHSRQKKQRLRCGKFHRHLPTEIRPSNCRQCDLNIHHHILWLSPIVHNMDIFVQFWGADFLTHILSETERRSGAFLSPEAWDCHHISSFKASSARKIFAPTTDIGSVIREFTEKRRWRCGCPLCIDTFSSRTYLQSSFVPVQFKLKICGPWHLSRNYLRELLSWIRGR